MRSQAWKTRIFEKTQHRHATGRYNDPHIPLSQESRPGTHQIFIFASKEYVALSTSFGQLRFPEEKDPGTSHPQRGNILDLKIATQFKRLTGPQLRDFSGETVRLKSPHLERNLRLTLEWRTNVIIITAASPVPESYKSSEPGFYSGNEQEPTEFERLP